MSTQIPAPSSGAHPKVRRDKVRLIIALYRKEGMSAEDFHTYWRETHAHVFCGIGVVKKNLLKYEQIHCRREAVQQIQEVGFPTADWDGLAVFDGASLEKIMEVFQDPEYLKEVVPDEENFLNRKRAVAFPAEIVPVFDDPS